MRITKYHGLGNDFIITSHQEVKGLDLSLLAIQVCDRHTGIGADGLIVVKKKQLEMVYYNSDGSRAKMCGNGIRCFSKYVYDEGINKDDTFTVRTLAGLMEVTVKNKEPYRCEVNMGKADYLAKNIPVVSEFDTFKSQQIHVLDRVFSATSLLLGATHTVIEADDLDRFDIVKYGKEITTLDTFPESTNVNFFERINESEIKMQTYERGAGLTLACGTGASAVVASLLDQNKISSPVKVHLPLGELWIRQDNINNIYMDGPAEKILDGEYGE